MSAVIKLRLMVREGVLEQLEIPVEGCTGFIHVNKAEA